MKNTGSSSVLTASFSFGDGEKSSAAPLFVFIAPDKDFKKPPFPGSHSHADILEGKMYRKVGSSKVVPLHAAVDPDGPWARALQHPSPTLHMLYRKHPVCDDIYIGIKQFHSVIVDEKRREFCEIMRVLGAKTIHWLDDSPWTRNYETPGSYSPLIDPNKFPYLRHTPQWQAIVNERTTSWPDNIQVDFRYDDHYSVNDETISILLKKLNIPFDIFFSHDSSEAPTPPADAGSKLYSIVSIPVKIIFFTKLDYEKMNRDHIAQHWGPEHVEILLKIWDMESLIPLVANRGVSIVAMLECKKEKHLESLLSSTSKDRMHINELLRRLTLLGDAEDGDLMGRVDAAAAVLVGLRRDAKAHNTETDSVRSPTPPRTASPPHESRKPMYPVVVQPIDVSSLESGEYSLVMIGRGGVGKTSLLKHILKSSTLTTEAEAKTDVELEFDGAEQPTVGPKLYHCAIGNVNIECWDTPGQDAHRGGVLLHTRRADIIFVVYDITSSESLRSVETIVADMDRNGLLPWATVCLIGNKTDLNEKMRQVETETAIVFARKYKFSNFFETSAKTGLNVNVSLSNALLKCEQGKQCSGERESLTGAIKFMSPGRAVSGASDRDSIASSPTGAGTRASACAC